MTKHAELRLLLRRSFSDVVHTTNTLNEQQFNTSLNADKWTIAEIIGHLILSTKAITKGLSTPKAMLLTAFGKIDRQEYPIDHLIDKYSQVLNKGLTAPSQFVYRNASAKGKEYMLSKFTKELDLLLDALDQWDNSELSEYVLPHPAIGNLTLREMIQFTDYHTKHHHKQINAIVNSLS